MIRRRPQAGEAQRCVEASAARLALAAARGDRRPPAPPARRRAPSAHFTARDLFGLEVATDPQISPDGRWIAYVRRSGDIMTDRFRPTIWLIDTRSGEQTPLVAGTGAHSQPRWSPDGDRLAYISTAEGGAAAAVRALDGERRVGADHRPARRAEQHRLVAGRPPDRLCRCSSPTRARGSARRRRGRKARNGPSRSQIITAVTYRADGAGLSPARLRASSSWSRPTAARRAS